MALILSKCTSSGISEAVNNLQRTNNPIEIDTESVKVVKDLDRIKDFLTTVKNNAHTVTFDYETTGLKPYRWEHRIYSISITAAFTDDKIETTVSCSASFSHHITKNINTVSSELTK